MLGAQLKTVVCAFVWVYLMPLLKVWISLKESFSVAVIGDQSQPPVIVHCPWLWVPWLLY
jgi:hypothetical protein